MHIAIIVNMGLRVTIYVRDDDGDLWAWATAYARRHRMPVSGLIMAALEDYRNRHNDRR